MSATYSPSCSGDLNWARNISSLCLTSASWRTQQAGVWASEKVPRCFQMFSVKTGTEGVRRAHSLRIHVLSQAHLNSSTRESGTKIACREDVCSSGSQWRWPTGGLASTEELAAFASLPILVRWVWLPLALRLSTSHITTSEFDFKGQTVQEYPRQAYVTGWQFYKHI